MLKYTMRYSLEITHHGSRPEQSFGIETFTKLEGVVHYGDQEYPFDMSPKGPVLVRPRNIPARLTYTNTGFPPELTNGFKELVRFGETPSGLVIPRQNMAIRTNSLTLFDPMRWQYHTVNGIGLGLETGLPDSPLIYNLPVPGLTVSEFDRNVLHSEAMGIVYYDKHGKIVDETAQNVLGGINPGGLRNKMEIGRIFSDIFRNDPRIVSPEWQMTGTMGFWNSRTDWGVYSNPPFLTPIHLAELENIIAIDVGQDPGIFEEYALLFGQLVHKWQSNGWVNLQAHPGNIGAVIDFGEGRLQVLVKDLDGALYIGDYPNVEPVIAGPIRKNTGMSPFQANLIQDVSVVIGGLIGSRMCPYEQSMRFTNPEVQRISFDSKRDIVLRTMSIFCAGFCLPNGIFDRETEVDKFYQIISDLYESMNGDKFMKANDYFHIAVGILADIITAMYPTQTGQNDAFYNELRSAILGSRRP